METLGFLNQCSVFGHALALEMKIQVQLLPLPFIHPHVLW